MNPSFEFSVLTTPGIVSEIASKLPSTDKGIVGLFMMVNNSDLRYELQPFIDAIALHNGNKFFEKRRGEIVRDLATMLNNMDKPMSIQNKAELVIQMFEYFCSLGDDIYLLGKRFSKTMNDKLHSLDQESIDSGLHDLPPKLEVFKTKLSYYIEWGMNE